MDDENSINTFCEISGVDRSRAKFFLESAGGDLETALAAFYEHTGDEDDVELIEEIAGLDASTEDSNISRRSPIGPNLAEPSFPQVAGADFKQNPESVAAGMSGKKVATLFNSGVKKDGRSSGSSSDDEDKGQAFYVGGSEKSGQEVLGPPKKREDPNDLINKVFKKAKERGAEEVAPEDRGASSGPKQKHFGGGGYRLGATDTDSHYVAGGEGGASAQGGLSAQGAAGGREPRTVTLKMWKNGFTVDDGELRSYDDLRAKMFLASVMGGEIPSELLRQYPHNQINLDMESHNNEDYKPPPMKPFSGQGQVLGGVLPEVQGIDSSPGASAAAATSGSTSSASDGAMSSSTLTPKIDVNESLPTTNIQVRLADGTRLSLKLNNTHKVSDIRRFLLEARPDYGSRTFVFMMTYPRKELSDEDQTMEEAGILNSLIVQRLK